MAHEAPQTLPNGEPFPPQVYERRAKHAAKQAAYRAKKLESEELVERVRVLEDKVKDLEKKP